MVTKKLTACFIFLICLAGTWLFYLKYSVISIEKRIHCAKSEILKEKKNHHILKAEWKSLTSPERIQRLADRHLELRPTEPQQLCEFDSSIFHLETKQHSKKNKRLSQLVGEILAAHDDNGGQR